MDLSKYKIRQLKNNSSQSITALLLNRGITDMQGLVKYIGELPYGRNSSRSDFSLVLKERMGTCSSKHALIKKVAIEQEYDEFKLVMLIFPMDHQNTPGIGNVIIDAGLPFIPEAHCCIKYKDQTIDVTVSDTQPIKEVIDELEILPHQVIEFKVNYHQEFLKSWIRKNDLNLSFEELWSLREKCILNLTR